MDWKSGGDTNFAPIASADGELDCRGFWDKGKTDKDALWTSNADLVPVVREYVDAVGANFGRVRVIKLEPQSREEAIRSIHRDDNNRFNPDDEGWVVRSWLELTDNPDSYMLLMDNGPDGLPDPSTEVRVPLHRGARFVVDTQRLWHVVVHPGTRRATRSSRASSRARSSAPGSTPSERRWASDTAASAADGAGGCPEPLGRRLRHRSAARRVVHPLARARRRAGARLQRRPQGRRSLVALRRHRAAVPAGAPHRRVRRLPRRRADGRVDRPRRADVGLRVLRGGGGRRQGRHRVGHGRPPAGRARPDGAVQGPLPARRRARSGSPCRRRPTPTDRGRGGWRRRRRSATRWCSSRAATPASGCAAASSSTPPTCWRRRSARGRSGPATTACSPSIPTSPCRSCSTTTSSGRSTSSASRATSTAPASWPRVGLRPQGLAVAAPPRCRHDVRAGRPRRRSPTPPSTSSRAILGTGIFELEVLVERATGGARRPRPQPAGVRPDQPRHRPRQRPPAALVQRRRRRRRCAARTRRRRAGRSCGTTPSAPTSASPCASLRGPRRVGIARHAWGRVVAPTVGAMHDWGDPLPGFRFVADHLRHPRAFIRPFLVDSELPGTDGRPQVLEDPGHGPPP